MAEYTPSEGEVQDAYVIARLTTEELDDWQHVPTEARAEFARWLRAHDARVRRDAALHEKQRIAGEVRFWASVNHDSANQDMGDLLDLVAGDIDRIPEETP